MHPRHRDTRSSSQNEWSTHMKKKGGGGAVKNKKHKKGEPQYLEDPSSKPRDHSKPAGYSSGTLVKIVLGLLVVAGCGYWYISRPATNIYPSQPEGEFREPRDPSKYNQNGEYVFVGVNTMEKETGSSLSCGSEYLRDLKPYPKCTPAGKRCGRKVIDGLIPPQDVNLLLEAAKYGLSLGRSNGGASILDLHSGALSKEDKFIDVYQIPDVIENGLLTPQQAWVFSKTRQGIVDAIAHTFRVDKNSLYLTKPSFFSRMDNRPAQTVHDEYWHSHIDKEQYGSFHYTALMYLTDYGTNFTGGRFIFDDKEGSTFVEPKLGRISFFTSGSENPHRVERVESGERYALTIAFTCDPEQGIPDPVSLPGTRE